MVALGIIAEEFPERQQDVVNGCHGQEKYSLD